MPCLGYISVLQNMENERLKLKSGEQWYACVCYCSKCGMTHRCWRSIAEEPEHCCRKQP